METMTEANGAEVTDVGATGTPVTIDQIMAAHDRFVNDDTAERLQDKRDELIRQALRQGMTKAELHRKMGLSEAHLGRIEKGRTTGRRPE
jgi:ribosome-binding protein aMBF1 (putative translation factor)